MDAAMPTEAKPLPSTAALWESLAGTLCRLLPQALHPLIGAIPQLSRYSIASAAALALDVTVYVVLTGFGWRPSVAGVLGYVHGLMLHFSLSTRLVFDSTNTGKSGMRLFMEFAASGLVGLGITALVIAVTTEILHLGAFIAKLAAVVLSFAAVFVLRRTVVFASQD